MNAVKIMLSEDIKNLKTNITLIDSSYLYFYIINALSVLFWGIWLLLPYETFRIFRPSLGAMEQLAPEWVWGIGMVGFSLCAIYGLIMRNPFYMALGNAGLLTFRIFQFILIGLQTNFLSTGVPDFIAWIFINIWLYFRKDKI